MKALVERIKAVGVSIGGGIIKVDEFLNHQVDPGLMMDIGQELVLRFRERGLNEATKVVTPESSGICPAFCVAYILQVPLIYARKRQPVTMSSGFWLTKAPSRTKGGTVKLMISREYLGIYDHVLVVDDWLASGATISALVQNVLMSRAELLGIGCVIEKVYEPGRERLARLVDVPIISLARVDLDGDRLVVQGGRY